MARYTGPKSKIARKFKEPIFGPDRALDKKNYPPGQHGPNKRRGKQSEYAVQLMEKQKAKYTYGILERQFSNLFKEASRTKGITGENLLKLCESRFDNVVFRMGLAPSRSAARQMVGHKHFLVNGTVVNIPSYSMKVGDVIEVRERSKSLEAINEALANRKDNFDWLEWDAQSMKGKFVNAPERQQIPENIKEQLIVELYSK
jgi:small subunit ribosomal protein S4